MQRHTSEAPPSLRGVAGWDERFVRAPDGTRLYTRRKGGTGRLTHVLCDGIACDGFIWRFLAPDLLPIGQVVHWNYRGHGRSAAPAEPDNISIRALVGDLQAVRENVAPPPVVLFGHSMGCQLVLEGYRHAPEGIAGLVLICGTAGRLTHTFKGSDTLAQALPKLLARAERHPQMTRALWANVPPSVATRVALATGEVDADAVDARDMMAYMEHAANIDPIMFLKMLMNIGEDSAEDMLASIEVPTLIIAGQYDTFTPPHLAEAMAAKIPGAELLMVPGGTHVVPIERRQLVRDRVHAFVQERIL
ncbi:MAG TPA: alpha/beta hydrolase [Sorangium sp.]|nr:alpha/beta hydrolase [Sorangium sp.]